MIERLNNGKSRYLRMEEIREHKKQVRNEKIVLAIASVFILVLTITFLSNQGKQAVENCVNMGYSKEYCIKGL
jgi:hypothetical protein